jgi:hypothetical protein
MLVMHLKRENAEKLGLSSFLRRQESSNNYTAAKRQGPLAPLKYNQLAGSPN